MHLTADIQIITERMLLRTVSGDDQQCVQLNWHLDKDPISAAEALSQIRRMIENHQANAKGTFKHLCLAMFMKDDMQFVGWCGLDNEGRSAINPAIFYLLKKAYWGNGLATEAAKALLT
jgi:RimJ/RimL family protein N-acetyltransferase